MTTISNLYWAVFQAKPRDIDTARKNFVLRFGQDVYDKYISNYYDRSQGQRALFAAPHTWYKWWMLNRLQELEAYKNNDGIYEQCPDYLFFVGDEHHDICPECGSLMDFPFDDREREVYGICYPCWADGRDKLWEEYEERLNAQNSV